MKNKTHTKVWILEPSLSHAIELERLCKNLNYDTYHLISCNMAVRMLKEGKYPDLIICDVYCIRQKKDQKLFNVIRNKKIPTCYISSFDQITFDGLLPFRFYEAVLMKPLNAFSIESIFNLLIQSRRTTFVNLHSLHHE